MQLFLIPALAAIFECAIAIVCDLAPVDTLLPFVASHINSKSSNKTPRVHCGIAGKPVGPHQKKTLEFVIYFSEMTYL